MSGNYFCHVCGGLVDLIKLQPSDVRLCECEKRFARLHAENERLKAELAEAKKDAERYRWMRDVGCATYKTLQTQWRMSPKQCDAAIDEAMKGK